MTTFEKIEAHSKAMVKPDGTFLKSDRDKLLHFINDYIEQKDCPEDNVKKIQNIFYYYCMSGVKEQLVDKVTDKGYVEDNVIFKNVIYSNDSVSNLSYVNMYKNLLLLDKKKKTSLWSERNVCFLNFNDSTRSFLKDNNYNTTKLEEYCWKYLNKTFMTLNQAMNASEIQIEKVKNICPNYLKKLDWSKIIMNSHLTVLLAKEYDYDLNKQQIIDYFNVIKPTNELNLDQRVTYFAKILNNSSFFKHNITNYKDLKDSLGKDFNVSMKNIKEYNENLTVLQKFIFFLAEHPFIKHDNVKTKLEKKEKIAHFGKPFLNLLEKQQFDKIKEERHLRTKTKKNKI